MPAPYAVAVDDMYRAVNTAWTNPATGAAAVLGVPAELRFKGLEQPGKTPTDVFWGRVSTQQVTAPLASLSNNVVAPGNRRYRAEGNLFVQLFAPKSQPNSLARLRLVAQSLVSALRDEETPNGVEFNNVRVNEVDDEAAFERLNVVADYAYDDIG